MSSKISIIVATDHNNIIWNSTTNDMPRRTDKSLKELRMLDMQHFVHLRKTVVNKKLKNVLIMWANTRHSIPFQFRPFDDNITIIMSKTIQTPWDTKGEEVHIVQSLEQCLLLLQTLAPKIDNIFCIWGSQIYTLFLEHKLIHKIYMTKFIQKEYKGDVVFPILDPKNRTCKKTVHNTSDWIQFLEYTINI